MQPVSACLVALLLSMFGLFSGCGDEAECPPGREKQGRHCQSIGENADAAALPTLDGVDGLMPTSGMDGGVGVMDADVLRDASTSDARSLTDDLRADDLTDADAGSTMISTPEAPEPAVCFTDQDGDGYGVMSLGACDPAIKPGDPAIEPGDCDDTDALRHPGAPDVCDEVDNDCDGILDEGVAEACNGRDDDCNGAPDDGFACVAGASEIACKTSCGTTGTGTCTSSCELPVGNACTPPEEVCNGIDDDCDGVTDPDLVTAAASAPAHVYTERLNTPLNGMTVTDTALLRRPSGGAWWLYRHSDVDAPSTISVRALDARGVPTTQLIDMSRTTRTVKFAAAADGRWVVIASHDRPVQGGHSLRIQLFRSEDLRFVGETVIQGAADRCGELTPMQVGVLDVGNQNMHIGVTYRAQTAGGPSNCAPDADGPVELATVTRTGETWGSVQTTPLGSAALRDPQVAILRSPCSLEWLVAVDTQLARRSVDGKPLGEPLARWPATYAVELASSGCDREGNAQLGIAYIDDDPWRPHFLPGVLSSGGELKLGNTRELAATATWALDVAHVGGRWFFLTYQFFPAGQLVLSEYVDGRVDPRNLWVRGDQSAELTPGVLLSQATSTHAAHLLSLGDVGEALVAGSGVGATGNLDAARPSGQLDPAVAVTYRFECPGS